MGLIPITTIAASVLAIFGFVLSLCVSLGRIKAGKAEGDIAKFPYGDGGNLLLQKRMRAFGNFMEYVPMCLIMLGLIEYNGHTSIAMWLAIFFVLGRVSHALGMLTNPRFPLPRMVGMSATYLTLLIPAFILLFR